MAAAPDEIPDWDRLDVPDYVERDTERVDFPGRRWLDGILRHVHEPVAGGIISDRLRNHQVGGCLHPIKDPFDTVACICSIIYCRSHISTCSRCLRPIGPCCRHELSAHILLEERRPLFAAIAHSLKRRGAARSEAEDGDPGAALVPVCPRCHRVLTTSRLVKAGREIHDSVFYGRRMRGVWFWGRS